MEAFLTENKYEDFKILNSITQGDYKDTAFKHIVVIDNINELPILVDSIIDQNGIDILDKIREAHVEEKLIDDNTNTYIEKFISKHAIIKPFFIKNIESFETKGPYTVTSYNFILQHLQFDACTIKYPKPVIESSISEIDDSVSKIEDSSSKIDDSISKEESNLKVETIQEDIKTLEESFSISHTNL